MCGLKRLSNLLRNIEGILNRNRSLSQVAPDRLSLDVCEHEEACTVRFIEAMHGGDIGVVQ